MARGCSWVFLFLMSSSAVARLCHARKKVGHHRERAAGRGFGRRLAGAFVERTARWSGGQQRAGGGRAVIEGAAEDEPTAWTTAANRNAACLLAAQPPRKSCVRRQGPAAGSHAGGGPAGCAGRRFGESSDRPAWQGGFLEQTTRSRQTAAGCCGVFSRDETMMMRVVTSCTSNFFFPNPPPRSDSPRRGAAPTQPTV